MRSSTPSPPFCEWYGARPTAACHRRVADRRLWMSRQIGRYPETLEPLNCRPLLFVGFSYFLRLWITHRGSWRKRKNPLGNELSGPSTRITVWRSGLADDRELREQICRPGCSHRCHFDHTRESRTGMHGARSLGNMANTEATVSVNLVSSTKFEEMGVAAPRLKTSKSVIAS